MKKKRSSRIAVPPRKVDRRPYASAYKHLEKESIRKPYVQSPDTGAIATGFWNVADLCKAYEWPGGLAGGGLIGIVNSAGGWFKQDIDQYFGSAGLPTPSILDFSVDGTTNYQGLDVNEYDAEVALGIQVAAASYAVATGKSASLRLYWSQDIALAVRAATADGCDVCSVSWGYDEAGWIAPATALEMEAAAKAATDAGMVIFAASGDNDSKDGGPNAANVDCPASCPNVVGCGGTTKTAINEIVWNNTQGRADGHGSGGGYSTVFTPLPTWQIRAPNGPGRMVPDVAANADPNTGYNIVVRGQATTRGGTSAVAPLYAGLFAAFGKKLGNVLPRLWLNPLCFVDITQGDNGAYPADRGPDPCTGLGVPNGTLLSKVFLQKS